MVENSFDISSTEFDYSPPTLSNLLQEVPIIEQGVSDPPSPTGTSKLNLLSNSLNEAGREYRSKPDLFDTTYYNPDLKERYKGTASLYNDYFDPKADNERIAYENWDKWDAISAGLGMFKDNFVGAFQESAYTWPRVAKALFNLDADYLSPTQEEAERMGLKLDQSRLENPIFYAPGTEDDFLTKGFMAETLGNLGFTFGTLGEMATEFVATTAIAGALAATGNVPGAAATEGAAIARVGAKLSGIYKNLTKLFVGTATDDVVKAAAQAGDDVLEKGLNIAGKDPLSAARRLNAEQSVGLNGPRIGVNLWDNALKITSKVPFVGQLADAARLANAAKTEGLTAAELMKIGAGGLRRSFAEWQMAAGEASIEAGHQYNETLKTLIEEYKKDKGQAPVGYDLENLKNLAMQSSTADFATNIAILGITNKIQWGNIIGKFGADSAALAKIKTRLGSNALSDAGFIGVSSAGKTKFYEKGLLGTLGLAPKIATDFSSKKLAAWEVGKSLLKGVTRIELSEGIQENLQEGTAVFLTDYYTDIYKQGFSDWSSSFSRAVDSQLTKQGAKTFLMGALTGLFVRPVMAGFSTVAEKTGLDPDIAAHRESMRESINILNNFYDSGNENILNESVKEMKLQTQFNDGMIEGLTTQDKYQYLNNRDSALIRTALHAKRTGTMDYLTSFIRGYGENFSEQEFQEAFGYSPADLGKSSPQEVLNDIASQVKRFTDTYDKYQKKFGLMLQVEDLITDPVGKAKFSIRRAALLDAITTAAFVESKAQQTMTRAKDIMQNITQYDSIGNSLAASFNTITNPAKLVDMLSILNNEIKILQEGEQTPETKKLIEQKGEESLYLNMIYATMFEEKTIQDPANPTRTITTYDVKPQDVVQGAYGGLAQIMSEYLKIKNAQNGIDNPIMSDEVNAAMQDIYDYMALGQDHAEYVEAVNLLNDPENLSRYHQNLMDARAGAEARLLYDAYMKMGEISDVAKKWLEENKDITDKILEFSKQPMATFKNYIVFDKLKRQLHERRNYFNVEKDKPQTQEQVVEKKQEETEKKVDVSNNNTRTPIPVIELESAIEENPENATIVAEYMAMRYDATEIESNFPFTSTQGRFVTRYYKDQDGNRVAFNNPVEIPVEIDFGTGEGTEQLDNLGQVIRFLKAYEQKVYYLYREKQAATPQQTDQLVDLLDVEKSKLQNHVGNPVLYDGKRGTLDIVDDNFVVKLEDQSIILGPVTEEASTDDFTDLSVDHSRLAEEDKAVTSDPSFIGVDTQESGTVTMYMDTKMDTVTINGITWNIEKDDKGLAKALVRTRKRKKGKGEKLIVERLSGNNPKAQEYFQRVNAALLLTYAPVPTTVVDTTNEIEVLDQAIQEAYEMVNKESGARKKGDELVAQYRLNQLINRDVTPEITALRTKFDNPETRGSLTKDDLLQLFVWADDLNKRIKKEWRVYITNPVVNSFLTQLQKEYINPIASLIDTDGQKRTATRTATKATPSKKKRVKKSAEDAATRQGKRVDVSVPKQPREKKGRTVSKAVNQVLNKADKKESIVSTVSGSVTDPIQKLPTGPGTRMINNMSSKKVSAISEAISASSAAPTVDINPFSTLNSKTSCEL